MTKVNLIEKRKKYIEQRINKLKEIEASLKVQERKKRTRRLIELGGLVSKAHLADWDVNTLFGALLFIKEKETDSQQLDSWTHKGGSTFASEKIQNSSLRKQGMPVIVTFETPPSPDVRATLKSFGLTWNAPRKEWKGCTQITKLKEILEPHEASIQKLERTQEE